MLEHLLDFRPLLDECHRVLRADGVLHVLAPYWRHVNAVADPTHVRFLDVQTFKYFCQPNRAERCWRPLAISVDGASVFADLAPVKGDVPALDDDALTWFFD